MSDAIWVKHYARNTEQAYVYWIREHGAEGGIVDIGEDLGQEGMEVKIAFPVSHNTLTIVEEYVQ